MGEHNPFDETIWDPTNNEQAIEDPMHGPSAVFNMLQTPGMPLGDGLYYQPGMYYTEGTSYVDANGKPIYRINATGASDLQELFKVSEWVIASQKGQSAINILEGGRQQERLQKQGFAHCFKTTDVCPGGKQLRDCETGNDAYTKSQALVTDLNEGKNRTVGPNFTTYAWLGGVCAGCELRCSAAVKMDDGEAAISRVTFIEPDSNMVTVHVDGQNHLTALGEKELAALDLDVCNLARLQKNPTPLPEET